MKRILVLILFFAVSCSEKQPDTGQEISVTDAMSTPDSGYAKALEPIDFEFPHDHGQHEDYKIEWWYFTGNLTDNSGRKFGYQFTIFRNALSPDSSISDESMATRQLYLAHFALSDISGNEFYFDEKFSRGAAGLAGAQAEPLRVWVENWELTGDYTGKKSMPEMKIKANSGEFGIELELKPQKDIVLHGDRGLSPKSSDPGNASYYYSLTRLITSGKIRIGEDDYRVEGFSWMDREWSTSALTRRQSGWDWFSVQLKNNAELMYFKLRGKSGKIDFSKGTIVYPDGDYEYLQGDKFTIKETAFWENENGAIYPSEWILEIPEKNIKLNMKTAIPDQELKISFRYYEGSIIVNGIYGGEKNSGRGYVEMTGYNTK